MPRLPKQKKDAPRTQDARVRASSQARRARHRDEVRRTIIDSAGSLVLLRGYDAFSLRELAESIGYTPTTLYRYFADKDALLATLVQEGFAEFGRQLTKAAERQTDPVERLAAIGDAYVRFALERPVEYELMFVRRLDLLAAPPPVGKPDTGGFALLTEAVKAALADSAFTARAPDLSLALWASVHGVASLALAGGKMFDKRHAKRVHKLLQHLVLSELRRR